VPVALELLSPSSPLYNVLLTAGQTPDPELRGPVKHFRVLNEIDPNHHQICVVNDTRTKMPNGARSGDVLAPVLADGTFRCSQFPMGIHAAFVGKRLMLDVECKNYEGDTAPKRLKTEYRKYAERVATRDDLPFLIKPVFLCGVPLGIEEEHDVLLVDDIFNLRTNLDLRLLSATSTVNTLLELLTMMGKSLHMRAHLEGARSSATCFVLIWWFCPGLVRMKGDGGTRTCVLHSSLSFSTFTRVYSFAGLSTQSPLACVRCAWADWVRGGGFLHLNSQSDAWRCVQMPTSLTTCKG
jgi:hypothetical protein